MDNEIFQIARTYLQKVRPSGPENIMATCPFHARGDGTAEKTPSFAMSLRTGMFLCHSCGAKGSLRTFLKHIGVSPIVIEGQLKYILEAAEKNLAPPPDPLRPKILATDPIDERLLGLFNYCPAGLINDGFKEETLQYFEVGFDKWHNCITWPVRDLKGQLSAVSGRDVTGERKQRYKFYKKEYVAWKLPERGDWDKRTVLYNAHRVYPELYFDYTPKPVIVVEGFKATAWVHQAGFHRVVGLMGSYLSWEHRWILERMGAEVYLFLDNNFAGLSGTRKAIETLRASLPVRIIPYPERLLEDEKAQPDSCSPEEILEQYNQAIPWYQLSLA